MISTTHDLDLSNRVHLFEMNPLELEMNFSNAEYKEYTDFDLFDWSSLYVDCAAAESLCTPSSDEARSPEMSAREFSPGATGEDKSLVPFASLEV